MSRLQHASAILDADDPAANPAGSAPGRAVSEPPRADSRGLVWIGIDPGASGAVAWVLPEPGGSWYCPLSGSERDVADCLEHLAGGRAFAYLERVGAMPRQGVAGMFRFGQSFGFCRGLLVAHRIPFELVAPSVWQRAFGLAGGPKDEGITAKKNRHKARAQELFPNLKITHACADALLLAEYCRRTREGLDRITSNP